MGGDVVFAARISQFAGTDVLLECSTIKLGVYVGLLFCLVAENIILIPSEVDHTWLF